MEHEATAAEGEAAVAKVISVFGRHEWANVSHTQVLTLLYRGVCAPEHHPTHNKTHAHTQLKAHARVYTVAHLSM